MTKGYRLPKLALEIIGYVVTSAIIASFSFGFLYLTSISLVERVAGKEVEPQFLYGLGMICTLAAMVVFFAFFLLFIGQKIAYILSINKGVQLLRGGDLTFRIACSGDDELCELADTINSFAEALQSYRQNEERLKKEKEAFIRSLSHDIRTPLTAIISYSDFIKSKKYDSDEKLESYINVIQNKAHQIQELTDLLLNLDKRQDEGSRETLLEGKLLFEQFISELEGALEDKDFQVEIDKLGLIDFKTHVNVQDITRVFDNLYSNIIKYADPQENIGIHIFLEKGYLTIIQTNRIKDKKTKGTESYGIGLKNIEEIVRKYEGEIKVVSDTKCYKIEMKIKV